MRCWSAPSSEENPCRETGWHTPTGGPGRSAEVFEDWFLDIRRYDLLFISGFEPSVNRDRGFHFLYFGNRVPSLVLTPRGAGSFVSHTKKKTAIILAEFGDCSVFKRYVRIHAGRC